MNVRFGYVKIRHLSHGNVKRTQAPPRQDGNEEELEGDEQGGNVPMDIDDHDICDACKSKP
jgi:hypothetical protein